jgi:DNA invertase Pin-like site-specific DNA recombinase
MKAIAYAAKSTADSRGSIGTQIADCRKFVEERDGWTVVAEYEDEAKSAYSGNRGKGLEQAMTECERLSAEHGSCTLIVQRSDRLARGDGKHARSLVQVVAWAIEHDVELVSIQDPEIFPRGELRELMAAVGKMKGHGESKVKGESVSKGMEREKAKGRFMGGRVPYGYRGVGKREDRKLEEEPAQANVVRSIFSDYVAGVSVREIARSLSAPSPAGGRWQRSAVSRILANVNYIGAIVDEDVWQRAQAIRVGHLKRKPGRHPDGGHLCVKGLLRCHCGSSMKPMRARSGVGHSVYRCSGRIEHGEDFCSQPGIHRELIDEPLLRHLLDRHTDLDAMRTRIAARTTSALADARRAVADREAEIAKLDRAMNATERAWDAATIDARQYAKREARLTDELTGARAARDQAREHAESASNGPPGGDPEQELLDHLATLKAAVADGVEHAPNLNALRNVLAELFDRVELVPDVGGDGFLLLPTLRVGRLGDGRWDFEDAGRRRELPAPAPLVATP